ncbi:MAG: aminotransferase class I/II-fold pyridoxal phosphate-dependent enzyme [Pseudomonadota bacterium]
MPETPDFIADHVRAGIEEASGRHCAKITLGEAVPKPGDLVLQTNDYLDIAGHPAIVRAKVDALVAEGHGDSISRVFAHHRDDAHRVFERRVARMMGAEDAVMTTSGYSANVGLIEAFAVPGHPVYLDQRAHASLWAGTACGQAKAVPFRHNNAEDLAAKIAHYGPGLVVIDSLYSTNGAIAPIADMVAAAEAGGCAIAVDETHAFGCHGQDGAGLVAALGLSDRVHFRTLGLSKAMAARGGLIACSTENAEYFRYEARSMIFSTSVLGYEVAGFDAALDIIAEETWRTDILHKRHAALKAALLDAGIDVTDSDSQIIAIVTGDNARTRDFRDGLIERGVHGSVFLPPATPHGKSLIRLTLNARLSAADVEKVADACAVVTARLEPVPA